MLNDKKGAQKGRRSCPKRRGPAQKWKMTLVIAYRADKGTNWEVVYDKL